MTKIVDSIAILDKCVRDAGLTPNDDTSLEHFTLRIRQMCTHAENAYYPPVMNAVQVEEFLNEVIKIANAAKVFNKHFGF